jgi:hypothetical protein
VSGTGRPAAVFLKLAAMYVGLTKLVVMAGLFGNGSVPRKGDALWNEALPVLATVVAGLVTSELILRWFR